MTVAQRETLLQAAVMVSASGNVIETRVFKEDDKGMIESLEMCIENLEYQVRDIKEVLTDLKQANTK